MAIGWMIGCIVLDFGVIVANIIEQLFLLKRWKHLDRIDHLLLSLSISDLINGIVSIVIDAWQLKFYLKVISSKTYVNKGDIVYIQLIMDSVFLFSVFASVFHVTALAIERLFAIRFPGKYYIFTTRRCKITTIAAVWISALLFSASFSTLTAFELNSKLATNIFSSILLTAVILVLLIYLLVAYFMVQQSRAILENFSSNCRLQYNRLKRQTIICVFVGISFVVCNLPITLSYFDTKLYHHVANLMIVANSLFNPGIYFIKLFYDARQRVINATPQRRLLAKDGRSDDSRSYNSRSDGRQYNSESTNISLTPTLETTILNSESIESSSV